MITFSDCVTSDTKANTAQESRERRDCSASKHSHLYIANDNCLQRQNGQLFAKWTQSDHKIIPKYKVIVNH